MRSLNAVRPHAPLIFRMVAKSAVSLVSSSFPFSLSFYMTMKKLLIIFHVSHILPYDALKIFIGMGLTRSRYSFFFFFLKPRVINSCILSKIVNFAEIFAETRGDFVNGREYAFTVQYHCELNNELEGGLFSSRQT